MQEFGLVVHRITDEQKNIWKNEVKSMSSNLRGQIIPTDVYDTVIELTKNN